MEILESKKCWRWLLAEAKGSLACEMRWNLDSRIRKRAQCHVSCTVRVLVFTLFPFALAVFSVCLLLIHSRVE